VQGETGQMALRICAVRSYHSTSALSRNPGPFSMKADPVTALFRRLVVLLSLVVLAWPLAVGAQQATTPTIAVLGTASLQSYTQLMEGFYQGLAETGYEAGKNIVVEQRWADGNQL
jgi:ABC-type uncharacterized transport system substrate-binding protein